MGRPAHKFYPSRRQEKKMENDNIIRSKIVNLSFLFVNCWFLSIVVILMNHNSQIVSRFLMRSFKYNIW